MVEAAGMDSVKRKGLTFMDKVYGLLQMFALLSLLILKHYNGERGAWKGMKWFFYLYYPAHLFAIGIVRVCIGNGSIFP